MSVVDKTNAFDAFNDAVKRGIQHAKEGRHLDARKEYEKAHQLRPNDPNMLILLIRESVALNDSLGTIAYCSEAQGKLVGMIPAYLEEVQDNCKRTGEVEHKGHMAAEALRKKREHLQRITQVTWANSWSAIGTGVVLMIAGGIVWGLDGHQSCSKAAIGHCAWKLDSRNQGITTLIAGAVSLGIGGVFMGVDLHYEWRLKKL